MRRISRPMVAVVTAIALLGAPAALAAAPDALMGEGQCPLLAPC